MGKQWETLFLGGSKITADGDCSHEIKRHLLVGRKTMTNLDRVLKSKNITLPTKVCLAKAMVFSSSHVCMWELDYKESWVPKNWCFWTVVLEKTLESPWTSRRSNQSILKNVHWKDWCWSWNSNTLATWCEELTHLKRPWCWERLKTGGEGKTEEEMVGWHHWLNGHESEPALEVGDGQGCLACCSP